MTAACGRRSGRIEFTRECFEHARQGRPKATLLINDYRTDPAYERVIEQLVDEQGKRLYDVIGIQSHMHGGVWPTGEDLGSLRAVRPVRRAAALHGDDDRLRRAELGQAEGSPGPPRPRAKPSRPGKWPGSTRCSSRIRRSRRSPGGISPTATPGRGAPAGFLRDDMTPKPAYEELKKLIKGKWWTTPPLATGDDGTAAGPRLPRRVQGHRDRAGATAGRETCTLSAGKENRLEIRLSEIGRIATRRAGTPGRDATRSRRPSNPTTAGI